MSDVLINIGPQAEKQIDDIVKKLEKTIDTVKRLNNEFKNTGSPKNLNKSIQETTVSLKKQNKTLTEAEKIRKNLVQTIEKNNVANSKNAILLAEQREKLKQTNREIRVNIQANNAAENSIEGLRKANIKLRLERDKLNTSTEEGQREIQRLNALIDANTQTIKENTDAQTKQSLNVGNYGEAVERLFPLFGRLQNSLGQIAESNDNLKGGIPTLQSLKSGFAGVTRAALSFVATPVGAIIAALSGIALVTKEFIDYNNEIKESLKLTENLTGLGGQALNKFRAEVDALSKTFDKEFNETLRASNSLTKIFGIENSTSLDLIQDGVVRGADASGDFLDNIREYAVQFKNAGFSAEDFIKITTEGATSGTFSDKLIDSLKELDLRLKEQTTTARDALNNAFGEEFTNELFSNLTRGSITTREALERISEETERVGINSQAAQQLTADLFGGAGEDAGGFLKVIELTNAALSDEAKELTTLQKLTKESADAQEELAIAKDRALNSESALIFQQQLKNAFIEVKIIFFDLISGFRRGFETFRKGVAKLIEPFRKLISEVPFLEKIFTKVKDALKSFTSSIPFGPLQLFSKALNQIGAVFSGLGAGISQVITNIKNLSKSFSSFDITKPIESLKNVFGALNGQVVSVGKSIRKGYLDALKESKKATEEETKTIDKKTEAVDKLSEAQKAQAKQRAQQLAKDRDALDDFRVSKQIDDLKRIADSQEESVARRIDAADKLEERERALINIKKESALADATNQEQRELIEETASAKLEALARETETRKTDIQRQGINERKDLVIENLTKVSEEINKEQQKQLFDNETRLLEGLQSVEMFEENKKNIILNARRETLERQLEFLTFELLATAKTAEEKIAIEERLNEVKRQLRDMDVQSAKDAAEKEKESVTEVDKAIERLKDQIGTFAESLGVPKEAFNTIFEGFREGFKSTEEAVDAFGSVAVGVFEQITASENARLDRRLENISKERDIAIQFAGDNVAAQEAINAQFQAKEAEIRKKQAQNEKKNAIFQIGVNTATAIIKTAAQLGFPAAIPFVAAVGAIGLAQAAFVASQPIPEFKEGVRDFGGGLAIVGDGGKREPITDIRGRLLGVSPDKPTLVNLPKGANVYSSIDEYESSINPMGAAIYGSGKKTSVTVQNSGITKAEMQSVMQTALGNVKQFNVNIDKKGVNTYLTSGGKRTANFLNNRVTGKGKSV